MSTSGVLCTLEGYHEYIGGYHEYIGVCSVHQRDIMIYVGRYHIRRCPVHQRGTMSTAGDIIRV